MELDKHGRPVKAEWGDGPWQEEPDRAEWRHAGLPCMARRGPLGAWCGYVGVAPDHPFHGASAFEDAAPEVDVHGGLTYSAPCDGDEGEGICHVPLPGEPAEVWWFGFDCGHAWDLIPAMRSIYRAIGFESPLLERSEVYRDLAYVTAETNSLADQLAALAHSAAASAGDQTIP